MEPQKVAIACLLCPKDNPAIFEQPGNDAIFLLKLWLGHVTLQHPDDDEAADQSRVRMVKFVDGIGGSARQVRAYVYEGRDLATETWSSGILAIDDEQEQDAWVLKHCGRRELRDLRVARDQQKVRLGRIERGEIKRYRVTFGSRGAWSFWMNILRQSGKIHGARPKAQDMLLEDLDEKQLATMREDATVVEIPVTEGWDHESL